MASVVTDHDGRRFQLHEIPCPVCKVDDTRVLGFRGGQHHRYGLGASSRIVQCRSCGLIYANPFPVPVDPQELYGDPEKYFEYHDSDAKIEGQRGLIREVVRRTGRPQPTIVDVGSGRGELLRAGVLEGQPNVVGLELSDAMIADARTNYGVVVHRQTIEEHAAEAPGRYDAVVLNAVLEHVYDPDSMIAAAKRLTHPGSILYIDTPVEPNLLTMVKSAMNRLSRSDSVLNLSPTFSPYHVFGFNRRSIRHLLAKHDFAVDDLRVWAHPKVHARTDARDRARAFVGTQVNRLANYTRTASNMYVWARRLGS